MEEIRNRTDADVDWTIPETERPDWVASSEGEPPFHIPRD